MSHDALILFLRDSCSPKLARSCLRLCNPFHPQNKARVEKEILQSAEQAKKKAEVRMWQGERNVRCYVCEMWQFKVEEGRLISEDFDDG